MYSYEDLYLKYGNTVFVWKYKLWIQVIIKWSLEDLTNKTGEVAVTQTNATVQHVYTLLKEQNKATIHTSQSCHTAMLLNITRWLKRILICLKAMSDRLLIKFRKGKIDLARSHTWNLHRRPTTYLSQSYLPLYK